MVKLFILEKERAGRALVERLDTVFDVRAALWVLNRESNRWRLVLGISEVRTLGRRRMYERIVAEAREIPDLPLSDVEVVPPDDPLLKSLRRMTTTGRELTSIQLPGDVVSGRDLEDVLVHRLM